LTREIPFLPPTKKKQSYFFEDSADKSLQTLAKMILSRFLNSKDGDHVLSLMRV
jgi:hypothetical protein